MKYYGMFTRYKGDLVFKTPAKNLSEAKILFKSLKNLPDSEFDQLYYISPVESYFDTKTQFIFIVESCYFYHYNDTEDLFILLNELPNYFRFPDLLIIVNKKGMTRTFQFDSTDISPDSEHISIGWYYFDENDNMLYIKNE